MLTLGGNLCELVNEAKLLGRVLTKHKINVQKDLDGMVFWSEVWLMVNSEKCKVIQVGLPNHNFIYKIAINALNSVSELKDLVIILTRRLKFSRQFSPGCSKASKMLSFITRNFEYKSKGITFTLYKSLGRLFLFSEKISARLKKYNEELQNIINLVT